MNSDCEQAKKDFEVVFNNTKNVHLRDSLLNNPEVINDVKKILNSFTREWIPICNWGLFEIPLKGNYRFINWKTRDHVAFANYFYEEKCFLPIYVDEHSNEQVASSLRQAIEMERLNT